MSDRDDRTGDLPLPDGVLEELAAAFAESGDPRPRYDFDDPSIDRILGIDPTEIDDPTADLTSDVTLADEVVDDEPDDDVPGDDVPGDETQAVGDVTVPEATAPVVVGLDATAPDLVVRATVDPDATAPAIAPPPVATPPATPVRVAVTITDDELPDPVYLDTVIESGGSANRADPDDGLVRIGDLDEGLAPTAPAPSGGGIDPRMRARRIAARRAEGRRRLVIVGIVSAVLLVALIAVAVIASPLFDVTDVRVQGNVYTDPAVVGSVVDKVTGEPVLLVDTHALEAELEADPWVESAVVATHFPHGLTIDIRERQPLATYQGSDLQYRVIDVQGRVLDVIAGRPVAYMLITGTHPDAAPGQYAGAPYAAAGLLVRSLPAEIRSLTRSIGIETSTRTMSLALTGTSALGSDAVIDVRLGDDAALDEKLARLLYVVRSGLSGVTAIDVSTPEIGIVRG